MTVRTCAIWMLLLLTMFPAGISARGDDAAITGVQVQQDEGYWHTRIVVPVHDGEVDWRDIVEGIASAERLNIDLWRARLPSGTLKLNGRSSRFTLLAINTALSPTIHLRTLRDPATGEPNALEITVDREAFEEHRRDATDWLRKRVTDDAERLAELQYGLELDDGWQRDRHRPLVILVHGFNSRPGRLAGLAADIRQSGHHCGLFGYPNDQSLGDSARRLSQELKRIAAEEASRSVTIVAHSMGGLVARAAIEDPELDPGNVRQLIMIATPNHGSLLARGVHGLDVWEHWISRRERPDVSRCFASIADGLAEANRDLRPGSPFLNRLNARDRHPQVRYTLLLGTGGPLADEQLQAVRDKLALAAKKSRTVRLFDPRIDEYLADLDELVRGKGDGIVALKRGRLAGVEDTQVLDFFHDDVTGVTPDDVDRQISTAVLQRLKMRAE